MGGNGIEKDIPAHLYVEVEIVKIACIQVCARNSTRPMCALCCSSYW